jgi:hypothetical protein
MKTALARLAITKNNVVFQYICTLEGFTKRWPLSLVLFIGRSIRTEKTLFHVNEL